MKKKKKILATLMIMLTIFCSIQNIVLAGTEISSAGLYTVQKSEMHLQYWNADKDMWYYVLNNYIGYNYYGKIYPAYCINRELGRSR